MMGTTQQTEGSRPVIGVTPRWFAPQGIFCAGESIGDGFMNALLAAGALPVMVPITADRGLIAEYVARCDGFAFSGGHNIDPARWGDSLQVEDQRCPERDALEFPLMEMILEADKPFLGICRGMQVLNVTLGGSLVQDLTTCAAQGRDTLWRHAIILDKAAHPVLVEEGSLLQRCADGARTIEVNSSHMQCIDRLGDGAVVCGRATDGIIESIEVPGKRFCLGVQWHPEYTWQKFPHDFGLYRALVEAAR